VSAVKPQAEIPKCGWREFETDRQYGGSTFGWWRRESGYRCGGSPSGPTASRQNATLNFGMHSAAQCTVVEVVGRRTGRRCRHRRHLCRSTVGLGGAARIDSCCWAARGCSGLSARRSAASKSKRAASRPGLPPILARAWSGCRRARLRGGSSSERSASVVPGSPRRPARPTTKRRR